MEHAKLSRNSLINIVAGVLFLVGGVGFVISVLYGTGNGEQLGETIVVFFSVGFVFLAKGFGWWRRKNTVEKDELSMKIGYTSFAASLQILTMLLGMSIIVNSFTNFLDMFSAKQIVLTIIWIIVILIFSFQSWYNTHPEKTRL